MGKESNNSPIEKDKEKIQKLVKPYIAALVIIGVLLVGMYIIKIFFPEQFMMVVQNETILKVGAFVDSHIWLQYITYGITAFITYWLYCCAVSKRFYLKWYECLIILGFVVINRVINCFDTTLGTAVSLCSFLVLPALTKGGLKESAIVCSFHVIAQALSLTIRSLPIYLTHANSVTIFLMTADCYLWLLLFYVLLNFLKRGE